MKLFGIPIKTEPTFFIVVAFLAMSRSGNVVLLVEWVVVVIVSVLLHEFGHAFAARAFGLSPEIRLYQMGGQTSWHSETELSPLKHLIISLAGPFAGFVLGGLVFLSGPLVRGSNPSVLVTVIYLDLLWVNIWWGLFNLLPMLPLDGGGILTTLEAWLRRKKDQLVSHALSMLVALTITWWAFSHRWLWIGFLGIWFAYVNGSALLKTFQSHRDRNLETQLNEIRETINRKDYDEALDLIDQVEPRAKSHEIKRHAACLRVATHLNQGALDKAEEALGRFTALYGENLYLQGVLLFLKGDPEAALPVLQSSFEESPEKQIGLMIYKCLVARRSFAGALDFSKHPVLAETRWELLVDLQGEAFNHEAFEISSEAGKLACEQKAEPNVAYNVACSLSRKGETAEALEWIRRAIDLGFNSKDALRSDPDLEAVRSLPEFGALLEQFD